MQLVTRRDLHEFIQTRLQGTRLFVVSNREPYMHRYSGGRIECIRPASGLTSALDPVLLACGGTWIAHGSGPADRKTADAADHVAVPPENPQYTLRRVWLTKEQENGYYFGLANEGLWPLCHIVFTPPKFDPAAWELYREVNALFAKAVLEEAGDEPAVIFIQDYHLALLPRMLKNRNPNLTVAQFWHIPWPNRETFRVFPWAEELLDGLLGNDLLGFHLQYHCQNFLDAVGWHVEAKVDLERYEVTRAGRATSVRPFPISIDFEEQSNLARTPAIAEEMVQWRSQLRLTDELIGIGLDRIDYTKGITQKLKAIDLLLERREQYRGRLVFVQVGVPSRTRIARYQALVDEIESIAEEINWKWGDGSWRPVVLLIGHEGPSRMIALHRLASFCLISALHDGMNLVAKEFVASRTDLDGVLVLSRFAGAAQELSDALLINPFSVEEMAGAIVQALEMPETERAQRMQRLRDAVASNTIYNWAGRMLSNLLRVGYQDEILPTAVEDMA